MGIRVRVALAIMHVSCECEVRSVEWCCDVWKNWYCALVRVKVKFFFFFLFSFEFFCYGLTRVALARSTISINS